MSKYIKLEDAIYADCILIDEIECDDCPFYDEEYVLCRMVKWLESLPTIDIVHCEDCRLATYTVKNRKTNEIFYACPYSSIHNGGKSFCSYGERKENE